MTEPPYPEELALEPDAREEMLRAGGECTLIWSTRDGWPVGVTMAYLWKDGRFWLCTGRDRPRVAAIRREPRVTIVVSAPARSITAKGRCVLREDAEARSWVYREFAAHQAELYPELIDAESFSAHMAKGEQMILEIRPEKWITYDGRSAFQH